MIPFYLGILGSGKGSNFAAILKAIHSEELPAKVAIVISDVPDANILNLASEAGISTHILHEPRYKSCLSREVEEELVCVLRAAQVELVVLTGFMRIIKEPLLKAFERRIINIHPSLLPQFRGLKAWQQALDAGVKKTGCTVHYVEQGVDTGQILAQSEVPVLAGDTTESLYARIQRAEHRLYPEIIRQLIKSHQ